MTQLYWNELKLASGLSNTDEDIAANIEHSMTLGLASLTSIAGKFSGAVAIVGSGPSLKQTWQMLQDFDGDILACNASFKFLLDRGIVPKFMFCFDADPLIYQFLQPVQGVTYLLGSRCPPKTFDIMKGCDIVCWHANGDKHIEEILQRLDRCDEPMVNGGRAAVTRAMYLAPFLGYKELHLFGADSSYSNGETHIQKSTTDEKWMPVMAGGRQFWCAPWMTSQAEDFRILVPQLKTHYGVKKIKVYGDGLIPHIARIMEEEERGSWRVKLRAVKHRARVLWQHI